MAALSGEPLYKACGYHEISASPPPPAAASRPGVRMGKKL
jgi:hypothetical protein